MQLTSLCFYKNWQFAEDIHRSLFIVNVVAKLWYLLWESRKEKERNMRITCKLNKYKVNYCKLSIIDTASDFKKWSSRTKLNHGNSNLCHFKFSKYNILNITIWIRILRKFLTGISIEPHSLVSKLSCTTVWHSGEFQLWCMKKHKS